MRHIDPDNYGYDPDAPLYLIRTEQVDLSPEKFADSIAKYNHSNNLFYSGGNLIDFEKKTKKYSYQPILVTEEVYKGLKSDDPNRNSLANNYWGKLDHDIQNVDSDVYAANLTWII